MRLWHAVSGILVGVLLLSTTSNRSSAQSFSEAVDVRVVNVDVYVTDRKGQPIEGLMRDDFVLFEDGREVEITNFYAGSASRRGVDDPETEMSGSGGPGAALQPIPVARAPVVAVVYLDTLNLRPAHKSRVIDDLERYMRAQAGDEVSFVLASHDRGLRLHGGFLDNPGAVAAAIETLGDSPLGEQTRTEYLAALRAIQIFLDDICGYAELRRRGGTPDTRQFLSLGADDPCECAWSDMIASWRGYAAAIETKANGASGEIGELISSLGGLEGRKALFYVSSGLQQIPGISVLDYIGELCPHMQQNLLQHMYEFRTDDLLKDLAARANANRVTFYPIDAGGMRMQDISGVDFENATFRPSAGASTVRRANLQAGLQVIAEETGGRAILNANQPFPELEALSRDFSSFYSLGFSPARDADGETHDLKVELASRRRGAVLRFRRSYRDKPLDERLGDRLMATLRFGVEDNPLAVSAAIGAPVRLDGNFFEVPVVIQVPADRLVSMGGAEPVGRVRVFLAAEDDRGRRTALKERFIDLPVAVDEGPTRHEVIVTMRLRAGSHSVSVGVRDEVGVELSLVRLAVDVDPEAAGLAVAPPSEG